MPVRNEEKYIDNVIQNILQNDYPRENMEVLIIDGLSDDKTVEIVEKYARQYGFIRLLSNQHKTVPYALNIGIKAATGDYIIRMDAHSSYPSDYFSKLIEWSLKLDADNVGAVCATDALNKTKTSVAIKKVMSDKFGVGNSAFRTGINEAKEVDTVPFGCYKREVFEKYGLFDERLTRNQDIEFNKRIAKAGAKIYLVPDITLTYYPRESYATFYMNRFNTGRWIIITSYLTKSLSNVSLRHFIPLIFLLSILFPLLLCLVTPYFVILSGLSLGAYMSLIGWRSVKLTEKGTSPFHLVAAFSILHISYGLGSLFGLFKVGKMHFITKGKHV